MKLTGAPYYKFPAPGFAVEITIQRGEIVREELRHHIPKSDHSLFEMDAKESDKPAGTNGPADSANEQPAADSAKTGGKSGSKKK